MVEESVRMLAELQEVLYAQSRWGLLLIFQAMDAAGKDSTIRHVMSGVNPQGVDVVSFKSPSSKDVAGLSLAYQPVPASTRKNRNL